MKRRRSLWSSMGSSTLLVGLLVLAPEAEARFGKRSSSKGSTSKPGRSTHAASPVGPKRSPSSGSRPRSRPVRHASASPRARGDVTSPRYASGSVAASAGEDPTGPRKNFVFGFDAQAVGFGGSAEYSLFDSLSVEGRAHLTPVPHRQLDLAGGLVWYFFEDLFALRGGMRLLVLDDAGLVEGVMHRDLLAGPYLSLGLAL